MEISLLVQRCHVSIWALTPRVYSRATKITLITDDDDRRRAPRVAEFHQLLMYEPDQVKALLARDIVHKNKRMGSNDELRGYRSVARLDHRGGGQCCVILEGRADW